MLLSSGALPARGRALEVGCGIASDALLLASAGFETHAVDADPRQVAAARRRATTLRLPLDVREASATDLPYAARRFDVVVDRLLWNNLLDDGNLPAYVDELARVVKPRGHVVVRAKSTAWWTIRDAFSAARRTELGGAAAWRRIGARFTLPRPPVRTMLVDPYGGMVPAVVAVLRRR